jgi:predicted ArsR family transcriptional regulator
MLPRTRALLRLLADDATDELVTALRRSAMTETELRSSAGISHRAAFSRLERLEDWGLAHGERLASHGRGRPARQWNLTAADEMVRFCDRADAFALWLLEDQVRRQRQGVDEDRRQRLRLVRTDDPVAGQ